MDDERVPDLPPPPEEEDAADDCRLWIGNLDTRLTEYSLIKLLQKYGELQKFDFLFHKSGPDQGKPRGYCFATFHNRKHAAAAMEALDGKLALKRRLSVKPAHRERMNPSTKLPMGGLKEAKPLSQAITTSSKIRAIEAKLRRMEEGKEGGSSVIPTASSQGHTSNPMHSYNHAQNRSSAETQRTGSSSYHSQSRRSRPYHDRSKHKR